MACARNTKLQEIQNRRDNRYYGATPHLPRLRHRLGHPPQRRHRVHLRNTKVGVNVALRSPPGTFLLAGLNARRFITSSRPIMGPGDTPLAIFGVRMACLRFRKGSLLPFSGGICARREETLRHPSAGQAPLAKAEARHPHSCAIKPHNPAGWETRHY